MSTVVPSLFEIDGNRITCSGGISALDMMVALIERDHGRQLAAAVGDWFLHTHIREGFGPQRMDLRYRLGVADEKLLARAARHGDQHRDAAAPRGARAPGRHLAPPARAAVPPPYRPRHPSHYRWLRLERARQLLRETTLPVLDVALATGFASSSQFARAYSAASASRQAARGSGTCTQPHDQSSGTCVGETTDTTARPQDAHCLYRSPIGRSFCKRSVLMPSIDLARDRSLIAEISVV